MTVLGDKVVVFLSQFRVPRGVESPPGFQLFKARSALLFDPLVMCMADGIREGLNRSTFFAAPDLLKDSRQPNAPLDDCFNQRPVAASDLFEELRVWDIACRPGISPGAAPTYHLAST